MPEVSVEPELLDIDIEILRRLPAEGSKAGYHALAATVKHLRAEMEKALPPDERGHLSPDMLNGRLKSLIYYGYAVSVVVTPVSRGLGYQATAKGQQALAARGIHNGRLREVI